MSMTTAPAPTREAPITSIQPGGGLVFGLERAWGRARRAVLRRFFPGHVQRMAELRRGDCPGCPHDVLDPRDLKLVRNVCGYRFAEDPFAWRGRLGLARAGLAELLCATALLLPLTAASAALAAALHPAFWLPAALLAGLWLFILSFFRDPDRIIPADPDALVSPADGVVTHLEEVDEPGVGRAFRVSIFLSVFNVHVNRSPRAGTVARVAYYPGEFLDARTAGVDRRNEQLWLDLDDAALGARLRLKQIAGAIARRIVCGVGPGEKLAAGERYGMIKFGSRTDVLVPAGLVAAVGVKVGQAVRGGADVLLTLRAKSDQPAASGSPR
jgi:phosphatidylserine decarboxylase